MSVRKAAEFRVRGRVRGRRSGAGGGGGAPTLYPPRLAARPTPVSNCGSCWLNHLVGPSSFSCRRTSHKTQTQWRMMKKSVSRRRRRPNRPRSTASALRKKKLRLLLRKKAAEELKKEQERKAAERRRIIEERCGRPKNIDDANEDAISRVCKEYHTRIGKLEDEKFDLEYIVKRKDMEIADLNSQVNDLRGKFVKPTLKKVSKYENKFAKLQKKAAEFNFRNQLKVVKKKEFTLEEEDKEAKKAEKADWAIGKK
ncbi:unnamed protein product, partial [Iphiclides podalirius]